MRCLTESQGIFSYYLITHTNPKQREGPFSFVDVPQPIQKLPQHQKASITSLQLGTGKRFAIPDLTLAILLNPNALDRNKSSGILRGPVHIERIHAALVLGVEVRGLARPADDVGATLVGDKIDFAIDLALRELYGVLYELTLGGEVHA